jgi:hypothetical protein
MAFTTHFYERLFDRKLIPFFMNADEFINYLTSLTPICFEYNPIRNEYKGYYPGITIVFNYSGQAVTIWKNKYKNYKKAA